MTAVVGRAWGWVRTWGGSAVPEKSPKVTAEEKMASSSGGFRGWTSWMWARGKSDQTGPVEEFWEAQEKLQPVEIEDLGAGKQEMEVKETVPRWWNKVLPSLPWPRTNDSSGLRRRKHPWDPDNDGDFSDYGTPPPSPTPSSPLSSPFRFFAESLKVEIVPEHYEICFNFLRHLFDLFVVGFLWTVSPPTKLILEVLGVQGALKLWFHGMAMFFVSTVGMAGLLWLIQEYLPQFAFLYGIVQAVVISVSVRQSVILGVEEENHVKNDEESEEIKEHMEGKVCAKDKMKTS
ncbi:uncharacterized protein C6orf47 homolog [Genypterus blacodes]|uniref:uncharacterized protein C6orf47 homolog n=1 Tax=Genypterus blacodes TaxID=154954 RepID=UPI003F758730